MGANASVSVSTQMSFSPSLSLSVSVCEAQLKPSRHSWSSFRAPRVPGCMTEDAPSKAADDAAVTVVTDDDLQLAVPAYPDHAHDWEETISEGDEVGKARRVD